MKKILVCLMALLMLVGCASKPSTDATTEPVETQETTAAPTAEAETVAVEDLYSAFVESYYAADHSSDYYASGSPYVFTDSESADLGLVGKKMECEAVTKDEATLASLEEVHKAAVEEFKTLISSFAPTYDETVSFDNNKIVIILKDANNSMCYFANDGTMKIVMGDARGTFRLSEEEINSLVSFLDTNLTNVTALPICA